MANCYSETSIYLMVSCCLLFKHGINCRETQPMCFVCLFFFFRSVAVATNVQLCCHN